MLNCDESKSLRGVDILLTSNTGIGDVSLAVELRREKRNSGTVIIEIKYTMLLNIMLSVSYKKNDIPTALEEQAQINSKILE